MTSNYLCHHIAEVMGYAFGALNVYWINGKEKSTLSSGSWSNQNLHKLYINIIDDFSGDKMSGHFQIPHYAELSRDIDRFREKFDNLT